MLIIFHDSFREAQSTLQTSLRRRTNPTPQEIRHGNGRAAPQRENHTQRAQRYLHPPLLSAARLTPSVAAGQKASSGAALASSRSYILTSILPAPYRTPTILAPSIAPTASTEASYIALYTMIISLISLCGGTLADAKLDRYLKRMNADVNMPMDKTEAVLQKMIKQGYLVRIKENVSGEETVDWMVGPRGKVEVGNEGVRGLVTDVYGDTAPEDLSDRIKSSLGLDVVRGEQEEEQATEEAAENTRRNGGRPRGRPRRAVDVEDD